MPLIPAKVIAQTISRTSNNLGELTWDGSCALTGRCSTG